MFKKSILAIISVLLLASLLSGCNTFRGMGEDISSGGRAISRAA
ncbi:entericidin A/B family lipoprotein [Serratia sp. M24T3]|uniref:Entericidin A/B family lipoprotein n=1 Tax=Rouxiella sp. WC2420 TaxID=3234145 RepID=A0AB39VU27_9GAMM|nr:entericidin A/B family lipoprotein [Serratia sp. M24T3]EIC84602.1 entericidin B membrane lipoprotein [Serratia sp. M24T3]